MGKESTLGSKVTAIPEGFHTLTPYLVVRDAARAVDFYRQAFGAEVRRIHYGLDGKSLTHADLKIGDSMLMLSDEFPNWGALSPLALGGTSTTIHVYVEDADAAFERAIAAGATVKMPLADQYWGDCYGSVVDPFGHQWSFATRIKHLSEEEIKQAGDAVFAKLAEGRE
jgi:uncharacterized glyoxalase superfamily protein PhnB